MPTIADLGERTAARLRAAVDDHPYPVLFASLSGAHLFGFPSTDSDFDVRGVHVLPAEEMVGLVQGPETVENLGSGPGEIDLVTHDILKFARLMLNRNGSMLEQVYSPWVIRTTDEHERLKAVATTCITRNHVHHYLGFADNIWGLFEKTGRSSLKKLLYTFPVLLTGIHLMRTGEIQADLTKLAHLGPGYLLELIQSKQRAERAEVDPASATRYLHDIQRLRAELEEAAQETSLPEKPTGREALQELILRVRFDG